MKKYFNIAMIYTIIGLLCGVYYREFSKMNDFVSEETVLKGVHTHYLVLGMFLFLILASFQARFDLENAKTYKAIIIGVRMFIFIPGITIFILNCTINDYFPLNMSFRIIFFIILIRKF